MSRTTKVLAGLVGVAMVLSGWLWFKGNSPASPSPSPSTTAPSTTFARAVAADAVVAGPSEASARAAAVAMVALDERRLLNVHDAETMTAAVSTATSHDALVEQAVRQTQKLHAQLGAQLTLYAQPLRARTISVDASSALIDVWWVKVITSPTQLTAGDIWGTTRYTLTWDGGRWTVADEASHLGPWPTHSAETVHHLSGAAFDAELRGFTPLELKS